MIDFHFNRTFLVFNIFSSKKLYDDRTNFLRRFCAKRPYVRERKIRLTKICSFRSFVVKKVIAFCGGEMEVSSLLVEGGVLTHRFFRSQKLTLLLTH